MVTIDEMEAILNEIAEELPKEFYNDLNGGILLLPQSKIHPESVNNDLYIMGEYHNERDLGRYIIMYYGSFEHIYRYSSNEVLRKKLKEVLTHEFIHHLESLAGERDLELKDSVFIARYKEKHGNVTE